jgi:hypothetical protein
MIVLYESQTLTRELSLGSVIRPNFITRLTFAVEGRNWRMVTHLFS